MPLDYAERYDVAAQASDSILGTAKNFTVATLADIGGTLWNSLPLTPEVSTRDILDKLDQDALAFFNESPDTVRTASLIGGAFIPGGVALKLLGKARAGLSALSYTESGVGSALLGAVTGQRQKKLASEIEAIFAQSGESTKQFKQLRRQLYASNIGQGIIDNAIIEVAVVSAMNAHPYMEDYLKDPLTNFAVGAGIGGIFGTAFAFPATRRALADLTAPLEFASHGKILEAGYQPIYAKDSSLTEAAAVQRHTHNVRILDDIILNKETDGLTREKASTFRVYENAQRSNALLRAASWAKDESDEVKQALFQILENPNYIGIDKIRWYDLNKVVQQTSKTVEVASVHANINDIVKALADAGNKEIIASNFLTAEGKPAIAFIRLSTGEVFGAEGARNAALAVDVKGISETIKVSARPENRKVLATPVKDWSETNMLRGISSAEADSEFLIELKRMDAHTKEEIPHIQVSPDHLPRQNAFVSYLSKLTPEEQKATRVHIRSDWATYNETREFVEKTVSKDYFAKAIAAVESERLAFRDVGISENASNLLSDWIHGSVSGSVRKGIARTRAAFDAFLHKTATSNPTDIAAAADIWRAGQQFRDKMRTIADADGFVYLYRGSADRVKSAATVQSYTVKESVAKGFGARAEMYRVHVDNIIGTVGSGSLREAEVLVTSSHPQVVNSLPTATAQTRAVHVPGAAKHQTFTADEFLTFYADETTRQIREMLKNRMSYEEISARTNTTVDAIRGVSIGGELKEYPVEWRRYTDASKIDQYLHPTNKMYAVLGNPNKNPTSEALASLDNRSLSVANKDITEQYTMISGSVIANDALELYSRKDMMLQMQELQEFLSEIGNVRVGDVRYQSADQALRNLTKGPLITALGKQLIDKVDAMKRRLLEPLASKFISFRDHPELFTEFNMVVNKLYSLQGWRDLRFDDATGYGYIVQRSGSGKSIMETPVKNSDGSIFYIKQQEVLDALNGTRAVSGEILRVHNLLRHLTGRAPMNDLGFYLPPIALYNKSIAYIIDNTGKKEVQLLVANKADELEQLVQTFKKENATAINSGAMDVVMKGQQDEYNLARNWTDYEANIYYADNAKFHTGASTQAITPSDDRFVNNMMQGYENLIIQSYRKWTEMYLRDEMAWLDKLSDFYGRATEGQPKSLLNREKAKDAALAVKNIILGRDQLESSVGLKAVNSMYDFMLNRASMAINATVKSVGVEKTGSKEFFDQLNATLKQKGIDSPWQSFDTYLATTVAETRNIAPSIQSAANGLLATLNLRMFETAQAAINIMSLPILTWSALMENLPGTKINPQGDVFKFPLQIMFEGMRHMFGLEGKEIAMTWEKMGLIKQATRQYTELTASLKGAQQSREFMDKAVDAMNGLQNNPVVKDFFARPSDWAEEFTRKFAMHTGYTAAKRAYPGIDDNAATIAAIAFADRTIGNYHAAQRPALFQGTFGAALGLYQTYVLTYAQSIYRGLENRNFKQLGALALTQAGIFGISSWPGYHTLSENVVGHISDQHFDLTTGTYRAIDDPAARVVLYGLPSSLGPAFYTRGDVSPRIPSSMNEIAVYNGLKQGISAAVQIVKKTGEGMANGNAVQSMFEALSLQSMNRPIARWSELVSGSSITQQNNTMSPSSEVFTPMGVFARLLGVRPIEEQVTRNAVYLNRYYEALDHDRRQAVVDKLAAAIRNDNLDDKLIAEVASDYLRFGGTSKGWRSALNNVMLQSEEGTRLGLLRKLEPSSPLNRMIEDLY